MRTCEVLATNPEFFTDKVAVEAVDDVVVFVLAHDENLVDDELLLGLLRQVHLFDGDLARCCHLHRDVHRA